MEFQNIFKLLAAILIALVIGGGLGYYYAPEKIKTVDKIVEKEVIKTVHDVYDPTTGKVVSHTETTDTKDTTSKSTKEEILKTKKQYAIKGGVAVDPRDNLKLIPRVGAEVRLPFFDSWAGLEGDINLAHPVLGAYLRLEF